MTAADDAPAAEESPAAENAPAAEGEALEAVPSSQVEEGVTAEGAEPPPTEEPSETAAEQAAEAEAAELAAGTAAETEPAVEGSAAAEGGQLEEAAPGVSVFLIWRDNESRNGFWRNQSVLSQMLSCMSLLSHRIFLSESIIDIYALHGSSCTKTLVQSHNCIA